MSSERVIVMKPRAEVYTILDFLKELEQWEADLVMSNEAWTGKDGLPTMTWPLHDRWLDLQRKRNVLKASMTSPPHLKPGDRVLVEAVVKHVHGDGDATVHVLGIANRKARVIVHASSIHPAPFTAGAGWGVDEGDSMRRGKITVTNPLLVVASLRDGTVWDARSNAIKLVRPPSPTTTETTTNTTREE